GQEGKGSVKSARVGRAVESVPEMPFARVQGAIAGVAQQFGKRGDAVVEIALIAGRAREVGPDDLDHRTDAGNVVINAAHQHSPRWRAGGRGMEVSQADAFAGNGCE